MSKSLATERSIDDLKRQVDDKRRMLEAERVSLQDAQAMLQLKLLEQANARLDALCASRAQDTSAAWMAHLGASSASIDELRREVSQLRQQMAELARARPAVEAAPRAARRHAPAMLMLMLLIFGSVALTAGNLSTQVTWIRETAAESAKLIDGWIGKKPLVIVTHSASAPAVADAHAPQPVAQESPVDHRFGSAIVPLPQEPGAPVAIEWPAAPDEARWVLPVRLAAHPSDRLGPVPLDRAWDLAAAAPSATMTIQAPERVDDLAPPPHNVPFLRGPAGEPLKLLTPSTTGDLWLRVGVQPVSISPAQTAPDDADAWQPQSQPRHSVPEGAS